MGEIREVTVPDVGDAEGVEVIEVLVSPGDSVKEEDSLITLESDKASMDVPAPFAGTVKEVQVSEGDTVSEGDVILTLETGEAGGEDETDEDGEDDDDADGGADDGGSAETEGGADKADEEAEEDDRTDSDAEQDEDAEDGDSDEEDGDDKPQAGKKDAAKEGAEEGEDDGDAKGENEGGGTGQSGDGKALDQDIDEEAFDEAYASPSVRRFARELGVDLGRVEGSGRKGRITRDDVRGYVQERLETADQADQRREEGPGGVLPEMPRVDFSRFGEVEEVELSRIRKLSARNVHRSWLHVPHVTQFDEADVTELEAFRKSHGDEAEERGFKLTPIAFLMKASVAALQKFPDFNSSLAPDGERLIRKKYYHLGIAVDTDQGLMVPVIRDVDQKGLLQCAEELVAVAKRARDGKLKRDDIEGATFTISSLGGIGGTAFTPIVNAPEVAILGASKMERKPVWRDGEFVPRLMLPLSLSYDHRVIDGAAAARFTTYLARVLSDLRMLLL